LSITAGSSAPASTRPIRVIDQQRHVTAAECRRGNSRGIRYVERDRYDVRQVDAFRIAYAGIKLFHSAAEQLSRESQAETAIGFSDEGNRTFNSHIAALFFSRPL